MNESPTIEVATARRRFDAACEPLRVELHRFCSRMVGNPCDGEDVLQDALVLAFYRYAELRDPGAWRAWIFRIVHNKCIDFLRGRRRFETFDEQLESGVELAMDDALENKFRAERALTTVIARLPPRERACVILKDVLDWSLEETAAVTGSNVTAVKAALHRGRGKLLSADAAAVRTTTISLEDRALVERYLGAFNSRDWTAVQALLAEDARLEVVQRVDAPFKESGYFVNHERLSYRWKLALAEVDGVERIVRFVETDGTWAPHSVVELTIEDGAVALVRDYIHVEYLLRDARVT